MPGILSEKNGRWYKQRCRGKQLVNLPSPRPAPRVRGRTDRRRCLPGGPAACALYRCVILGKNRPSCVADSDSARRVGLHEVADTVSGRTPRCRGMSFSQTETSRPATFTPAYARAGAPARQPADHTPDHPALCVGSRSPATHNPRRPPTETEHGHSYRADTSLYPNGTNHRARRIGAGPSGGAAIGMRNKRRVSKLS